MYIEVKRQSAFKKYSLSYYTVFIIFIDNFIQNNYLYGKCI